MIMLSNDLYALLVGVALALVIPRHGAKLNILVRSAPLVALCMAVANTFAPATISTTVQMIATGMALVVAFIQFLALEVLSIKAKEIFRNDHL
jgi:hypothetical protein